MGCSVLHNMKCDRKATPFASSVHSCVMARRPSAFPSAFGWNGPSSGAPGLVRGCVSQAEGARRVFLYAFASMRFTFYSRVCLSVSTSARPSPPFGVYASTCAHRKLFDRVFCALDQRVLFVCFLLSSCDFFCVIKTHD